MTYYEQQTGEPFTTTAIYPNRIKNKEDLEAITDLVESGSEQFSFKTKKGTIIAEGYLRIVHGDHGPYTEHLQEHILWDNLLCERKGVGYYNKWYPKDGSRVLIYDQIKTVNSLPNPPPGKMSYKGNRKEGYADYRIGRVYISPYDVLIIHR